MAERRSYADRRSYLIEAVRRRLKVVRQKALVYKGARCQNCGYDRCMEALEFHHLASSRKDFGISSKGYTRSWIKIRQELDKCILLCANCHRRSTLNCSFHRKLWLKHRVNSGKPTPPRGDTGTLSEACRMACE